jgi:UTP-glucose-1-phosphate uridylyltransferase
MRCKNYIKAFATKFGFRLKTHKKIDFLVAEAVELGAIEAFCILTPKGETVVDFYFDRDKHLIGWALDSADSFKRVRR